MPGINKRTPRTLAAGAIIVLAGRVTDLYLMIIAPFAPGSSSPKLWDLGALALVGGAFVFLTLRAFFQREPLPVGDRFCPKVCTYMRRSCHRNVLLQPAHV